MTAKRASRAEMAEGVKSRGWSTGELFGPVWLLLTALTASTAFTASTAHGQFFAFGQNKIQYRTLDWRIIRGPHVDLYYYRAEAELAPAALAYAEASYD